MPTATAMAASAPFCTPTTGAAPGCVEPVGVAPADPPAPEPPAPGTLVAPPAPTKDVIVACWPLDRLVVTSTSERLDEGVAVVLRLGVSSVSDEATDEEGVAVVLRFVAG